MIFSLNILMLNVVLRVFLVILFHDYLLLSIAGTLYWHSSVTLNGSDPQRVVCPLSHQRVVCSLSHLSIWHWVDLPSGHVYSWLSPHTVAQFNDLTIRLHRLAVALFLLAVPFNAFSLVFVLCSPLILCGHVICRHVVVLWPYV